jgi:ferrochelatase
MLPLPASSFKDASLHEDVKDASVATDKIGVLLVNLGTPDALGFWPVRRYLKEFLSDRRVVKIPRIIWWPILNFVILTLRPHRSAKNYAAIWNKELNEGPLKTITRSQAEKLAAWIRAGGLELQGHGVGEGKIAVAWAMRYGRPTIAGAIEKLKDHGCTRLLVVPLYPQYAGATTASVGDKVSQTLKEMRWQPEIRTARPYFNDPTYIDLLATSLRAGLSRLTFVPEYILVSFHGIPKASVDQGDPYYEQCLETWRLLREHLELSAERCPITFQSRFGPTQWLEPYTDATVKSLALRGVKNLVVITPGFSADCLETISEIGIENRAIFQKHGGENFALMPCLNDSAMGMMVICKMVARELKGWA